jgi:acid stress-induced BolA-like protein IbaG/YrbA
MMAMNTSDIAALVTSALADAKVDVQGEGGKYQVQVVSTVFEGLNRVKRQQAVYRLLNEHIQSGAIHAVSMVLKTPAEAGTTSLAQG